VLLTGGGDGVLAMVALVSNLGDDGESRACRHCCSPAAMRDTHVVLLGHSRGCGRGTRALDVPQCRTGEASDARRWPPRCGMDCVQHAGGGAGHRGAFNYSHISRRVLTLDSCVLLVMTTVVVSALLVVGPPTGRAQHLRGSPLGGGGAQGEGRLRGA
jgi:hypothetical protein